ncbi:MAG: hypothetical protein ACM3PF_12230 [Bacteroidota bacterium]
MKRHVTIGLLSAVLLLMACARARADSFQTSLDPPRWAVKSLNASNIEIWPGDAGGAVYTVSRHLSPNYVEGDFDGDGKTDLAILVRRKADDKFGIALVLRAGAKSGAKATVLGAGNAFGKGGSDLRSMDAWSLVGQERFPPGIRSAWKGPKPKAKPEGLLLEKRGSPVGLITYDGSAFAWSRYGERG